MRRLILFVLAISLFPALAHAQLSVYFTSINTHFSNVQNGQSYNPTTSTYTNLITTSWPPEFGGGVTFTWIKGGPLNLGLDVRGSTTHGTTGADTVMAGPRLSLRTPIVHIKPYIAAEAGYVDTRTAGSTVTSNGGGSTVATNAATITNQYAAWEIFGGVDVPIFSHIDFRAVEIGGGRSFTVSSNAFTVNSSQQITLFSIDTGIVVHF